MRDDVLGSGEREGFVRLPDGRALFYRAAGKGPLTLVMPVNWGMDSYIYSRGFSALRSFLTLVTFDPRGVGRSDPVLSIEEFSLEQTAEDARLVAETLEPGPCIAMGHSSGGAVALVFALRHPELVDRLVLIAASARGLAPYRLASQAPRPKTEDEMRARLYASMTRAVNEPDRFRQAIEGFLPRMRFSPERFRWTAEAREAALDLRPRLHEIHIPVLIVHGREDPLIPLREAEELHRRLPKSRLRVLEGCGHWPHVERRREFLDALRAFLGPGGARGSLKGDADR